MSMGSICIVSLITSAPARPLRAGPASRCQVARFRLLVDHEANRALVEAGAGGPETVQVGQEVVVDAVGPGGEAGERRLLPERLVLVLAAEDAGADVGLEDAALVLRDELQHVDVETLAGLQVPCV